MLDPLTAGKFFTIEVLAGFMSMVAGFALGDVADNLLTWFDNYATKTATEGTDKKSLDRDPSGTAIEFDFLYHYLTLAMGLLTFSAIAIGGFTFAEINLKFFIPTDCDFDYLDASRKAEMIGLFQKAVVSLDACYDNLPAMMQMLDFNKNGFIDRCEDAYFSYNVAGNTKEYSAAYGNKLPVVEAKYRCDQIFNPLY